MQNMSAASLIFLNCTWPCTGLARAFCVLIVNCGIQWVWVDDFAGGSSRIGTWEVSNCKRDLHLGLWKILRVSRFANYTTQETQGEMIYGMKENYLFIVVIDFVYTLITKGNFCV